MIIFIMFKHVNFGKHIWIHMSKIKKNIFILNFIPGWSVYTSTRLFFFFSSRVEISSVFFSKRVFTREISSRDETRPGMKSSLSMVKWLTVYTFFPRRNFIPGWTHTCQKDRYMKYHPGMKKKKKKKKKTCKNSIPG